MATGVYRLPAHWGKVHFLFTFICLAEPDIWHRYRHNKSLFAWRTWCCRGKRGDVEVCSVIFQPVDLVPDYFKVISSAFLFLTQSYYTTISVPNMFSISCVCIFTYVLIKAWFISLWIMSSYKMTYAKCIV